MLRARLRTFLLLLAAAFCATGCGNSVRMAAPGEPAKKFAKAYAPTSAPLGNDWTDGSEPVGLPGEAPVEKNEPVVAAGQIGGGNVARKIQYGADFQLVTDHFATAETTLHKLIDENQGYVSYADVYNQTGSPRHGVWKARIPVAKFDSFRKAVDRVGEVVRTSVQTKDVTAEYYDLEEHVKSQKAQEEALRELLKKTTDKIDNIIAVRRELGNLRDEIERSEGRMRLLANLTDLTTVTVQIEERAKFDPDRPTPTIENPTFAERADKAFRDSWTGLVFCAQVVALAGVVLAPWMPLIVVAAGLGYVIYRKSRSKAIGPTGPTPPPAT